jgi:hypothetical protein
MGNTKSDMRRLGKEQKVQKYTENGRYLVAGEGAGLHHVEKVARLALLCVAVGSHTHVNSKRRNKGDTILRTVAKNTGTHGCIQSTERTLRTYAKS